MSVDRKAQPTQYEICVSGHLCPERAMWFGNMDLTVKHTPSGSAITVLSGPVTDRAALFGILSRIRDLGLVLISVNPIVSRVQDGTGSDAKQEEGK